MRSFSSAPITIPCKAPRAANDNASGVAALLEIARLLAEKRPTRTVRFVAFVNEESPIFYSQKMGSRVYARRARKRGDNIVAMLSRRPSAITSMPRAASITPCRCIR